MSILVYHAPGTCSKLARAWIELASGLTWIQYYSVFHQGGVV